MRLEAQSARHWLGILFGLLSAVSAGGAYVIIRFLGTAKVGESGEPLR